ncbi:hypothetical protein BDW75DRAFT_211493, partial [Aspergillus navahoensis]
QHMLSCSRRVIRRAQTCSRVYLYLLGYPLGLGVRVLSFVFSEHLQQTCNSRTSIHASWNPRILLSATSASPIEKTARYMMVWEDLFLFSPETLHFRSSILI